MKISHWLAAPAAVFIMAFAAPAAAQGSVDDQAAVWAAVERLWEAEENGDNGWVDEMLSADFMGWPKDSPAPRSRASVRLWSKFDHSQFNVVAHELYPLSIVVHGNMAIVHYLYTSAVESKDRKTHITSGRYTDVLVRNDGTWKFIAWHGGDDA